MTIKHYLREIARKTRLLPVHRKATRSLKRLIGLRHPIQDVTTIPGYRLIRLGSEGCGWTIIDDPALSGSVIISAGLGEDGSFDVEIAARYSATVHIVDPTPRAIRHFDSIRARLSLPRCEQYSSTGRQSAAAYDLTCVGEHSLILHKFALWNRGGTVKFFLPNNTQNVSHSIINFQNAYSIETAFIEVEAVTLSTLIARIGLSQSGVTLIKFDIEGAEIEVLEDILSSCNLLPRQILVEFDELNAPTRRGLNRVNRVYLLLVERGYRLIHTDGQADFLFVLADADFAQSKEVMIE